MADRFDVKAAYAALTADEQHGLGEAALLLAYAIDAKESFGDQAAPDATPPALPDLNPFGVGRPSRWGNPFPISGEFRNCTLSGLTSRYGSRMLIVPRASAALRGGDVK